MLWIGFGALSCARPDKARLAFDSASRAFFHGDLEQAQNEARRNYERLQHSSPQWAWKFRILEARAALWRGLFPEVVKNLQSEALSSDHPDAAIPALAILAVANVHTRNFSEAERVLNQATQLCARYSDSSCGEVLQAQGLLASERGDSASAEKLYTLSLSFAQRHGDLFLESNALLNLGAESLAQEHFDEALDQSQAAFQAAKSVDARILELVTLGNIGWAAYRLGDSEKALDLSLQAERAATEYGDFFDRENYLTNVGYIYMDRRQFDLAAQSFREALELADQTNSRQYSYNALRVLARLSLQTGKPGEAAHYAGRALQIAKESGNHGDELYPLLVQAQIASRQGRVAEAENRLHDIERDKLCPAFLKWEAQHSLAQLYQAERDPEKADGEYRASLATFEAARETVRHEDFQLSFLTNASRIYDDYIQFLVARGKTDDALRWADYSRARTLAEGLGLLSNLSRTGAPPLNAGKIADRAHATLLFYWLGEKQSLVWVVGPRKTSLFSLPPQAEIEAAVERYRKAVGGPQDVLESSNADGRWLYQNLVAPAQSLLAKDAKVVIIPDGKLNNLNFESFIVSEPQPHYWIEDVDLVNASSLRVLAASFTTRQTKAARKLLLVGDSVAPGPEYPELPKAAAQMSSVARHFPLPQQQVLGRESATPTAYLASHPEQFSHIHFVAHGTASRLSPLDSAIVLSKDHRANDSFKLYARDILRHPLRAELVTISACYGAGERSYSGEGLVGLSWAFLRAGAHNVIAALWEVTDASTEQIMGRFYDELNQGATPDAALRAAKLSLLRDRKYRNAFYWAPFQLYTGS